MKPQSAVTAVVLAFGEEPLLEKCVDALLASRPDVPEILVVDNGCRVDVMHRLRGRPGVRILEPGRNLGFAGGCNFAAELAHGDVLVFINSDAIADPDAVAALTRAVSVTEVGVATASVRLLERPHHINAAGNPVHFSGLSWAGGLGEPAERHSERVTVASASGCALAVRADVWTRLDGFCTEMFAYCEDTDLSLRCWQAGWRVEYIPEAVVWHDYSFTRHPEKLYLLERNRLVMVMTTYSARTLLLLFPALLGLEITLALVAARQGWGRAKVKGWWWLVRHLRWLRRRRQWVQSSRRCPDTVLAEVLTSAFEPGADTGIASPKLLVQVSRWYWLVVRRLIA